MDLDNTAIVTWNSHTTLNKKLPEEMIIKIISYLSLKDILHLSISKLFMPCLVNSSWFLNKINTYFIHLLGHAYYKTKNIFMICAFHPIIVNNAFYFSIDHTKLPYFKNLFGKNHIFNFHQLDKILKSWSILFQSYKHFKKHKRLYLKNIKTFTSCSRMCPCHKYKMLDPFCINPPVYL